MRGLKTAAVVMSASPAGSPRGPLPARGNGLCSPPPDPPVTPRRLHIWGKTPSWSSLLGLLETFSACFGDGAGRAGLCCLQGTSGKSLLWTGPEGFPCYLDLGLLLLHCFLPLSLRGGGNLRRSGQRKRERKGGGGGGRGVHL